VLAACGLVALDMMIDRLDEDHRNARRLAEALADAGFGIDPSTVQTNMVYFDTKEPAKEVQDALGVRGVLCFAVGRNRIRMVTHKDVAAADIDRVAQESRLIA
jgi:threonine aldolase